MQTYRPSRHSFLKDANIDAMRAPKSENSGYLVKVSEKEAIHRRRKRQKKRKGKENEKERGGERERFLNIVGNQYS